MGARGQTEESGGAGAPDNVVRLRDWFGSKDDLIPIGPAADGLEAEAEKGAAPEAASSQHVELFEPLNAEDFWGEGAGALHQPVEAPMGVEQQPDATIAGPAGLERTGEDIEPDLGDFAEYRPRFRGVRLEVGAGVIVVMLVAALTMFVFLRGGGHGQSKATVSSVAVRRDVPAGPDSLVALAKTVTGTLSVDLSRLTARRRHVAVQRRASTRHRTQNARPTRHRLSRHVASGAVSTASSPGTVAATSDASSTSSYAPAPAPISSPAPASASSSASASPSSASGPSGLGGVVGPQCNPQCSASGSHS